MILRLLLALCLALLYTQGSAYTLLPLSSPASRAASARSWGQLRSRLSFRKPTTQALQGGVNALGSVSVVRREASSSPNAPLLKEKRERMILHSVSGTAPSPTTSPEAAEDGVELLIDELGKIDEAMKESLEDIENKAKAIDTGLRQGFEEIEKGFKDTLTKATTSMAAVEPEPEPTQEQAAPAPTPTVMASMSETAVESMGGTVAAAAAAATPVAATVSAQVTNSKASKTRREAAAVSTTPPADEWDRESLDYGAMRTGKIVQLWSNGDFSTFEFTKAMAARLNTKVQTAFSGAVSGGSKAAAASTTAGASTTTNSKALAAVNADAQAATYMEGGWARRGKGSAFFRTLEIWKIAVQFLFKEAKVRKIKDLEEQKAARRKAAIFAREVLLKLGPTFIKFGQLLSTRIDILPKEYTEELSYLQDNVPGFSGAIAKQIIAQELGRPVEEAFDTFDEQPLAAASLGQVHLATYNGEKLAIKIQRQGLRELFDLDLKNLKVLAILLDKFDPKNDGAARDWKSIYEESAKLLYKEIDYENEGRNAERFANDFKDIPWVKVPKIYWDFTSKRVLAMEYCPGIKVSDIQKIEAAGIDRQLLAKRSAESYLFQLCRHGFFHCDPHPGNVACDNYMGGRLIYYDFGMMDEFRPEVKKGLVDLIFSVYEGDAKATCDAMEDVGILRRGADRVSVEKIARFFLAEFSGTLKSGGKWLNELDKEEQKRQKASRRAQLGADLLSLSTDLPFKFPPTFTFVFRAFTSLDGIGKGLDEKYDLTRLAQPFLKELIELRDGSATISILKDWQKKLGWRPQDLAAVVQSPRRVAQIEDTLRRAEQGDLKLRVRVLESERAFKRIDIVQSTMINAVMASMFLNAGIMLSATAAGGSSSLATKAFVKGLLGAATLFGLKIPVNYMKLRKFDRASVELGLVQKA